MRLYRTFLFTNSVYVKTTGGNLCAKCLLMTYEFCTSSMYLSRLFK